MKEKSTRIEGSIKMIHAKPLKQDRPTTDKAKKGATNGKRRK